MKLAVSSDVRESSWHNYIRRRNHHISSGLLWNLFNSLATGAQCISRSIREINSMEMRVEAWCCSPPAGLCGRGEIRWSGREALKAVSQCGCKAEGISSLRAVWLPQRLSPRAGCWMWHGHFTEFCASNSLIDPIGHKGGQESRDLIYSQTFKMYIVSWAKGRWLHLHLRLLSSLAP